MLLTGQNIRQKHIRVVLPWSNAAMQASASFDTVPYPIASAWPDAWLSWPDACTPYSFPPSLCR
jgi:hypothetical protein